MGCLESETASWAPSPRADWPVFPRASLPRADEWPSEQSCLSPCVPFCLRMKVPSRRPSYHSDRLPRHAVPSRREGRDLWGPSGEPRSHSQGSTLLAQAPPSRPSWSCPLGGLVKRGRRHCPWHCGPCLRSGLGTLGTLSLSQPPGFWAGLSVATARQWTWKPGRRLPPSLG